MRCEIGCRKNLDFGLCMLYLCSSEVRLHCTLISCTLALTDEKTVFLFYSFSVLWHGVTTKSRAGRPVWNPNMPLGFTLCFFMKVVSIPSTPFFYIKKALADFVYQLKPLLITQRKSFCNCREATSRSPLRSDRLGGAVRFPWATWVVVCPVVRKCEAVSWWQHYPRRMYRCL